MIFLNLKLVILDMEDKISRIILCKKMNNYTIDNYITDLNDGNKERMAKFIYERFFERYLEPFKGIKDKKKKNGFSLMAIACLMIEALESFWQGLEDTKGRSREVFIEFFSHCEELKDFRGLEDEFYYDIRCGILHQAETRGGWRISRKRDVPLLDKENRIINANKFHLRLEEYLKNYRNDLEILGLNSARWTNFKKKMNSIIKNCQL